MNLTASQQLVPIRTERRLRLGVVGLGHIFRHSHEPALRLLRDKGWPFDLVALADRGDDCLQRYAAEWPTARHYTSADELLEKETLDAVMLLLPTPHMPAVARLALQRCLCVFLEKPVAHDLGTLQELRELAERYGCRALVGYNRRHQPLAARLKALTVDPTAHNRHRSLFAQSCAQGSAILS